MSSLLKYKRHFKLNIRPNAPKMEVIHSVRKHFAHHPRLRDVDVLSAFLWANLEHKKQVQAQLSKQAAQKPVTQA